MKINNHRKAALWAKWLRTRDYMLLDDYNGIDEVYGHCPDGEHQILYFDGTDSIKELRNDFQASVNFKGYHQGFYDEAKKFENFFLESMIPEKVNKLTVICYSRGVYGLVWLLEQTFLDCDIDVFLFGCPMVSNGPLVVPKNINITVVERYGDVVPKFFSGYFPLPYNTYHKLGKWYDVFKFWKCKHREYIK